MSGAGAFEVAVADALVKHKPNVKGRAQLGVQAFADALLVIPKVISHPTRNNLLCRAVDIISGLHHMTDLPSVSIHTT